MSIHGWMVTPRCFCVKSFVGQGRTGRSPPKSPLRTRRRPPPLSNSPVRIPAHVVQRWPLHAAR